MQHSASFSVWPASRMSSCAPFVPPRYCVRVHEPRLIARHARAGTHAHTNTHVRARSHTQTHTNQELERVAAVTRVARVWDDQIRWDLILPLAPPLCVTLSVSDPRLLPQWPRVEEKGRSGGDLCAARAHGLLVAASSRPAGQKETGDGAAGRGKVTDSCGMHCAAVPVLAACGARESLAGLARVERMGRGGTDDAIALPEAKKVKLDLDSARVAARRKRDGDTGGGRERKGDAGMGAGLAAFPIATPLNVAALAQETLRAQRTGVCERPAQALDTDGRDGVRKSVPSDDDAVGEDAEAHLSAGGGVYRGVSTPPAGDTAVDDGGNGLSDEREEEEEEDVVMLI